MYTITKQVYTDKICSKLINDLGSHDVDLQRDCLFEFCALEYKCNKLRNAMFTSPFTMPLCSTLMDGAVCGGMCFIYSALDKIFWV